jgi:hypothetical protein
MLAYLDTSLLIKLKFQRSPARERKHVASYRQLFSSELLIAELFAFGKRERIDESILLKAIQGLSWVVPDRPILPEIQRIQGGQYVRGADLWHLACALYLVPRPKGIGFLTRDRQQKEAAKELGFATPDFD